MPFGTGIAKAKSKGHDVRRKLFLRRAATGQAIKLKLYAGSVFLGEVDRRGWNLELTEKIEFQTGERYYPLFIDLIDDPNGDLLRALKTMDRIKIGSVNFGILSKPSFLAAVPSYTFRVQPTGES